MTPRPTFVEFAGGPAVRLVPGEARAQLEALARTLPKAAGRLAIRLRGEPALGHAETLARAVRELELAPCDLLFDARPARLVRAQVRLGRAAEALAGTGHRLHVCLVGFENLSRAELERFDDSTTPLAGLDAMAALVRLERGHPETFRFRRHRGLSLILYTPWTTLEDLLVNLRIIEASRLEAAFGEILSSRLRLREGLPLTELARREGLLVERREDPCIDTALRDPCGEDLPWRFADARMEPVCRILARLSGEPAPGCDALARRVAAARGSDAPLHAALRIAEGASRELPPGSAPPAAEELLERFAPAGARAPARRGPRGRQAMPSIPPAEPLEGRKLLRYLETVVALAEAGLKPVAKVEPVPRELLPAVTSRFDLPNLRVREHLGDSRRLDLFFGPDARLVERAAELAGLCERARGSEAEAVEEIGRLLGYPACCARAYAYAGAWMRSSYSWLHVDRRLASPGPVSPALNPCLGGLVADYVPCRLDCPQTLRLAREAARALGEPAGGRANPWLLHVGEPFAAVELRPRSPVGERFRFKASGATSDLERAAAAADELVLETERVLLLRRGRLVCDLTARAFLWHHERAYQAPFWRRLLWLRKAPAPPAAASPAPGRPAERLLLVELAAQDGQAESFPELLGAAREAGLAARWLRLAGPATAARASLGAAAAEFRPTRVVFGFRPPAALMAQVRARAPGARLAALAGPEAAAQEGAASRAPGGGLDRLPADRAAWSAFLGLEGGWPDAAPDFGFEAAGGQAAPLPPVRLPLGPECTYDRPLAEATPFRGVDLSRAARRSGCSFCAGVPSATPRDRWAAGRVARQLAALRTLPAEAGHEVRLQGEAAFDHAGELARAASGLPPADFVLGGRPQDVLRAKAALEEAAAALERGGHRLHVRALGVESFSRSELERFNRGASPLDSLEAIAALLRLERDRPRSFSFARHRPLGFILFTPWTAPEDLLATLRILEACRLDGLCGDLLKASLRLSPGLPLTELARRDGLLAAAAPVGAAGLAWRFAHPRMDALRRLLAGLDGGAEPLLARRLGASQPRVELAAELVERAWLAGAGLAPDAKPSLPGGVRGVWGGESRPMGVPAPDAKPSLPGGVRGVWGGESRPMGVPAPRPRHGGADPERLVGPRCCARAEAGERDAAGGAGWLHLARRLATPGRVAPALNPGPFAARGFVPCRLDCREALAFVRREGRREPARRPWLLLLHGAGSLGLEPASGRGERFRVRQGEAFGALAATGADEALLEPERLLLLRRGRSVRDLTGRAFVWWHERALQADFWRPALEARALLGERGSAAGAADAASEGAAA